MYTMTFTVTGTFAFPLDMLRYDNCYPADQDAVGCMQSALNPRSIKEGELRVTLRRAGATKGEAEGITPARWESFGWRVVHTGQAQKR